MSVNKTMSTNMDDPVEVLMTENIRHFIRTVLLTSDLPNDTRDELRKYGGATRRSNTAAMNSDDGRRPRTIPFDLLRSVHDMQLVPGAWRDDVVLLTARALRAYICSIDHAVLRRHFFREAVLHFSVLTPVFLKISPTA